MGGTGRATPPASLPAPCPQPRFRRLLHRNVKPASAGFNLRGDVVLCNFGLARDLPDGDEVTEGAWKLTGETGSLVSAPSREKPRALESVGV